MHRIVILVVPVAVPITAIVSAWSGVQKNDAIYEDVSASATDVSCCPHILLKKNEWQQLISCMSSSDFIFQMEFDG